MDIHINKLDYYHFYLLKAASSFPVLQYKIQQPVQAANKKSTARAKIISSVHEQLLWACWAATVFCPPCAWLDSETFHSSTAETTAAAGPVLIGHFPKKTKKCLAGLVCYWDSEVNPRWSVNNYNNVFNVLFLCVLGHLFNDVAMQPSIHLSKEQEVMVTGHWSF